MTTEKQDEADVRERLMVGLRLRVDNDFTFHPAAPGGEAAEKHDKVRNLIRAVALQLIEVVPIGREQSLMLTAFEEAMHWGNAGIAKVNK